MTKILFKSGTKQINDKGKGREKEIVLISKEKTLKNRWKLSPSQSTWGQPKVLYLIVSCFLYSMLFRKLK